MVRPLNRLWGLVLGLALAGAAGIAAVEVVLAALSHQFVLFPADRWLHVLRSTQWSSRTVTIGTAVAAALGFVLLVTEVRPRRPRRVRLAVMNTDGREALAAGGSVSDGSVVESASVEDPVIDHMDWWLLRQSVESHLRRVVLASTPISRARVRLMARRRHWRARIRVNAPAGDRDDVKQAARASLERLGAPTHGLRVKVRKLRLRKPVRVG